MIQMEVKSPIKERTPVVVAGAEVMTAFRPLDIMSEDGTARLGRPLPREPSRVQNDPRVAWNENSKDVGTLWQVSLTSASEISAFSPSQCLWSTGLEYKIQRRLTGKGKYKTSGYNCVQHKNNPWDVQQYETTDSAGCGSLPSLKEFAFAWQFEKAAWNILIGRRRTKKSDSTWSLGVGSWWKPISSLLRLGEKVSLSTQALRAKNEAKFTILETIIKCRQPVCTFCGKVGHMANQCQFCDFCYEFGHTWEQCDLWWASQGLCRPASNSQ